MTRNIQQAGTALQVTGEREFTMYSATVLQDQLGEGE
jgi:hypothetical protein